MTRMIEEIAAATDVRDPEEYISRVKSVVLREIVSLDPLAKIVDTHYFNHSAIPDFVVNWDKSDHERSFYIRDSLDSYLAGRDPEFLPNKSAGIITLDIGNPEPSLVERVTDAVESTPRTLLTTISALDTFKSHVNMSDPIGSLARNLFVRGARGLVDENLVIALDAVTKDSPDTASLAENLVLEHFVPESASVIRRTADLLRMIAQKTIDESDPIFAGVLSSDELSRILPWVLDSSPSNEYLSNIGKMFSFADLEELSSQLQGYDLTALVESNSNHWTATRAYGGLYIPPEKVKNAVVEEQNDDDPKVGPEESSPIDITPAEEWNFRGSKLGLDLPALGQRIEMVHSGRLLKGRPSQSAATWDALEEKVRDYKPLKVDLRGLRRSVVINAEESDDIRQDVESITETVEDTYYVQSITVDADSGTDTPSRVEIDFGQSLAIGECLVQNLLKISRDLLITDAGPEGSVAK